MRRIGLVLLCALSLSQPGHGQASRGPEVPSSSAEATAQEITRLDRQLDEASISGDKAAFDRILAADVVSIDSDGELVARADVLNRLHGWPADSKASLVAADAVVRQFGDMVIASSNKTLTWDDRGHPQSDAYRETRTYQRIGGHWQLVARERARPDPPYTAPDVQKSLVIDPATMIGNASATVVLVEFSDYQCSFCRRFAAQQMKQIEKDYVSTGRVGVIAKNMPMEDMHPYAFKAALAARCAASQGRFIAMHERLFQEPMALEQADLLADARAIKLDMPKFGQCMADDATAAAVRQEMREADALGISGTPTFLIGVRKADGTHVKLLRMILGARPYEAFKTALDTIVDARNP